MADNEWGHDVDAVLFSRFGADAGPAPGANPGFAGDLLGVDTRVIAPGANEVSVRAFVTDMFGGRVPGAAVTGSLFVDDVRYDLRFVETTTPDGDLVYDAQRIAYTGGDVRASLLFDFDRNGGVDDTFGFEYREL